MTIEVNRVRHQCGRVNHFRSEDPVTSHMTRTLVALLLIGLLGACTSGDEAASAGMGGAGAGGAGAGGAGGVGSAGAGGAGSGSALTDYDAGDVDAAQTRDASASDGGVPDADVELTDAGAPDAALVEIDLCDGVDCRSGSCVIVRDQASCECPPQFTGDNCEQCAPGHTGAGCATCEDGYLDRAGVCVATACVGVDCGDHGTCRYPSGQAQCECAAGFTGAVCDQCALGYTAFRTDCVLTLPTLTAPVALWLDGMRLSTMDVLGNGDVSSWRNRVTPPGGGTGNFWGSYLNNAHLPNYSLAQRGLVFDHDTMESLSDIPGSAAHYTMIFVMRWDHSTDQQIVWHSRAASDGQTRIVLSVEGSSVTFRHRGEMIGPTDNVNASFFADSRGPMHIVIAKRAPFLNGTVMVLSDGTQQASTTATAVPLSEPHLTEFGVANNAASGHMDATLHEVIFLRGTISTSEQQSVVDYLRVKWGL